jgi:O-6-methylguanine DNA methyltransferase
MQLYQIIIPSPIGDLIAIANDDYLIMLDFIDHKEFKEKLARFPDRRSETNIILKQTQIQLFEYFEWQRKQFDIPLKIDGTEFQKAAWKWLQEIPYGETRSYGEQAKMISRPKAVRAIGGANHNNRIVIIIPCHRVIGASGKLVGYGGWLDRKIWLLEHEKTKKFH